MRTAGFKGTVAILAIATVFGVLPKAAAVGVDLLSKTPVKQLTVLADATNPAVRIVEWETYDAAAPVTVTVSGPRPGVNPTVLADGTTDAALVYDVEENARRYFSVGGENTETVTAALRVLPLEGGRNFRDLGGYKTADGSTVKWGLVYRSGILHGLTDTDYDFVGGLGIETVFDFRSTRERSDEPTEWQGSKPEFLTWDYEMNTDSLGLFQVFANPNVTPQDVTDAMTRFYYTIVDDHAEKYALLFDRLAEDDAPLAFHCSAGKDRTGVAAALVLTALGVPRETVVADYALSEQVVDYMAEMSMADMDEDSPYAFLAKLPPEVVRPLMRSNPAYIEATLDVLEERHGSVLAYIQSELNVDDAQLERLRARLLER